jgi:phosphoglycerate kinase
MRTYLVRINLDVEKKENFLDSPRIKSAVASIKHYSRVGNKIVLLSHRGRPKGFDRKLSLESFVAALEKLTGKKIVFLPHFDFKRLKKTIALAPAGSVFLLENLRFLLGETQNSRVLAKNLASLGTNYVNDDFASSHRENASLVEITRFLPSEAGPNLKREIINLSKIIQKPKRPLVVILGGAKAADKLPVIKNLLSKADYILTGGAVANTFLKAEGTEIGNSLFESKMLDLAKRMIRPSLGKTKIILPQDTKKRKGVILDIGPKTIEYYAEIIAKAKTVVWAGPMGVFEKPGFERGSVKIAKAIVESRSFSVAGGGETSILIEKCGLTDRIDFVSNGGGVMLYFLAGKKLPAIDALKAAASRRQKYA